jgi:hypothetical protein
MVMVLEYMSEYLGMVIGALALLVVQAICDLSAARLYVGYCQ